MSADPRPIRVLLVDDDRLAQSSLRSYVEAAGLVCAGVADDGAQACAFVRQHPVDVVLMDLRMPVMNGIDATRRIRSEHPGVRVVALTSFDEDADVARALAAGASGFLLKSSPPDAFADAVRLAFRGLTVLPPSAVDRWIQVEATQTPVVSADLPELTDRERDVLAALCRGLSNQAIAEELYLSHSSVKNTITTLMHKLDAASRLQIVVRAHALGLDQPA